MNYVRLNKYEDIVVIGIARPEAFNALTREIVDEMDSLIESIKKDDQVKCLVLYSEKNFAAGADIKDMINCDEDEAEAFSFTPTFNKIEALNIPVVAGIEGCALGGGLELALTADIRIAGRHAKLGFPEITLGIFPGAGGTVRAPRLVGEAVAKELIFTGKTISGEEAKEIGLVNQVVQDEDVYEATLTLAKRISKGAPVALRAVKETIRAGRNEQDVIKATKIEMQNWARIFATEDQKEGMRAFIEKRKPQFNNK